MFSGKVKIPVVVCENAGTSSSAYGCRFSCPKFPFCTRKEKLDLIRRYEAPESKNTAFGTNHFFEKFVIDGRSYSRDEVLEILMKHKAEEDKHLQKCDRCNASYAENNKFNMVALNLDRISDANSAWGYSEIPYIEGFKVSSHSSDGRKIKLCDKCIAELIQWLTSGGSNNKARG